MVAGKKSASWGSACGQGLSKRKHCAENLKRVVTLTCGGHDVHWLIPIRFNENEFRKISEDTQF